MSDVIRNSYPNVVSKDSTRRRMVMFVGFLSILLIAAAINYGPYVFAVCATSYLFAFIVELSFAKVRKRKVDTSAIVTPMIFTLVMPPTIPLWVVAIGVSFGVFFGKAVFGGMGKNIFNPAIVGRLFVTISFPAYMATMWKDPKTDVITAATPLGRLNATGEVPFETMDLLIGQVPGSMGETFRIGIIIIGIALIVLKIIDWRVPVSFIGFAFILTGIGHLVKPETYENPVISLLVGGILFGAFFVATDPVTSPMTSGGKVLYGFGLAVIMIAVRNFAAFPEGIMFAIIIMNALTFLLDDMVLSAGIRKLKRKVGLS